MGKRAGMKRTEKKKLVHAIKIAKIRDEAKPQKESPTPELPPLLRKTPLPTRALPQIREIHTMVGLPPLVRLVAEVPPTIRKPPSPANTDVLNLFPEKLDQDLGWDPDEFDREYFRLWKRESERKYSEKRNKKKRKRIIEWFGMDSHIEREMERDRRRDLEEDLFGGLKSTDEEEKKGELERMQVEEEKEEELERMQVEEEKAAEMEIEEEKREEDGRKERKKEEDRATEGAGASRGVVPNKIRDHWLKSKTRLDLSAPLS